METPDAGGDETGLFLGAVGQGIYKGVPESDEKNVTEGSWHK